MAVWWVAAALSLVAAEVRASFPSVSTRPERVANVESTMLVRGFADMVERVG